MGEAGCWCVTFFSLLVVLVVKAVQSSPCWRKMGRNRRFGARWESFVPGGPAKAACWESFVPVLPAGVYAGRVLYRNWPCVRYKVRPARPVGGASGIKFSLHAEKGPISAFWGEPGEFCTGIACQGCELGEFCTGWAPELDVPGEFCTGCACRGVCGRSGVPVTHNKTARRVAGRWWSGRRESNPPLKLGKLPFYR